MPYNYESEKHKVLSEDNLKTFLSIRDRCNNLATLSGVFTMGHAISNHAGINWTLMACVDRLVELGEFMEIDYGRCAGQDRIFKKVH